MEQSDPVLPDSPPNNVLEELKQLAAVAEQQSRDPNPDREWNSSFDRNVSGQVAAGEEQAASPDHRVEVQGVQDEAACIDPVDEALAGRPSRTSWLSWFKKVCRVLGPEFDKNVLSGSEAEAKWKKMSECDREAWKKGYHLHIAAHHGCKTPTRTRTIAEQDSAEKLPMPKRMPDELDGPQPQFTERVASLGAFRRRWAYLKKELGDKPGSSFFLSHSQEMHLLYLDVVSLLDSCFGGSAQTAENSLSEYCLNRKKISKIKEFVQTCEKNGTDVHWAPPNFHAGRHGSGLLTVPQKKDLVRHITAMSMSNRFLLPHELKHAMYKFYLINIGVLQDVNSGEVPWEKYKACETSMDHVYRDFRAWCRDNYPPALHLVSKKLTPRQQRRDGVCVEKCHVL